MRVQTEMWYVESEIRNDDKVVVVGRLRIRAQEVEEEMWELDGRDGGCGGGLGLY